MSKRVQFLRYDIPFTNADRIRRMSDEELAKFLVNKLPPDISDWEDLMLKWLQQPAEELWGLNNSEDF